MLEFCGFIIEDEWEEMAMIAVSKISHASYETPDLDSRPSCLFRKCDPSRLAM